LNDDMDIKGCQVTDSSARKLFGAHHSPPRRLVGSKALRDRLLLAYAGGPGQRPPRRLAVPLPHGQMHGEDGRSAPAEDLDGCEGAGSRRRSAGRRGGVTIDGIVNLPHWELEPLLGDEAALACYLSAALGL
jgi:hypothetical protein